MMNRQTSWIAIFLCGCAACCFGREKSDGNREDANFGAAITIEVPRPKCLIEIENPLNRRAELLHVGKHELTKVADINEDLDGQAFVVPTGIYVVSDLTNEVRYPAPALHDALAGKPLKVKIRNEKPSEDRFVWIPPGPALIGDSIGVGSEDEGLAVKMVPGFWMEKWEVTNQQFAKFLSAQEEVDERWIDLRSRKCLLERTGDGQFTAVEPDKPVVMVSLQGAQAYCRWLSEKTGQLHRLPTEIEWEKAARGPCSYVYSYGNVYSQSMSNQATGTLQPVGSYPANAFGLFDMTGNVFEWMSNRYDTEASEQVMNHALRGGSFVLDGMYLRNSFRMRQCPSVMTDDIGFRVVRDSAD